MATSSLSTQRDGAVDHMVVRKSMVSNQNIVAKKISSDIMETGVLDANSFIVSGGVVDGDLMVNGDLDVVNGQIMARSLILDDKNGDGNMWSIQEDTGGTGALVFYYTGSGANQLALDTQGQLIAQTVLVGGKGFITDLQMGTLSVSTSSGSSGATVILYNISGVGPSFTLTLDAADNTIGKVIYVLISVSHATNVLTVQPSGTAQINGLASLVFPTNPAVGTGYMIVSDGTNWFAAPLV